MAKTIKRRGKNSSSGCSEPAAAGKLAATTAGAPPIQELQDLMDSQQSKLDVIKAAYSQQNTQLAKSNSSLLMKLTDFEKRISELVQENIVLRSRVSMNHSNYKEKLNQQISILEEGISQRFEEIFHMFKSIRRKENLPTVIGSNIEPKSILRSKRSRPSSGRASSIHFQSEEISNLKNCEETKAKKKRKSSRRESIFMPGDFEFTDNDEVESLGQPEQQPTFQPGHSPIQPGIGHQSVELPHAHEDEQSQADFQSPALPDEEDEDCIEGSFNFTSSIIDYSIPEETAANRPNTGTETDPAASSSKLDIFRDELQETMHQKDTKSPTTDDNKIDNMTFLPLEASQSKVKHSMRPPNTKTRKKKFDEVMPSTNSSGVCDLEFPRARRTRGKAIDYTLPSLRAKMRRPSEKLVDATTFTNIQDLQVRNSERKSSKSGSRKSTITPDPIPDLKMQLEQPQDSSENLRDAEPSRAREHEVQQENPEGDEVKRDGISNTSMEKSVSSEGSPSSIGKSSGSSGKALKDITNTPKPKPGRTKKLLKNAIINDLCDRVSNGSEDPNISSSERSVSFRLHEDDLSVFDLIGSHKVKHPQRTYRAKSKRKDHSEQQ